jgi:hypothetical protein
MTAKNILDTALALINEDVSAANIAATEAAYQDQFILTLNLLLAETFDANNSMLASKGQTELISIPSIAALTDTMPYDDIVCKKVLPFGIAGQLCVEDNPALSTQYKNKYEYEKTNCYKANYYQIDNYYGDVGNGEDDTDWTTQLGD